MEIGNLWRHPYVILFFSNGSQDRKASVCHHYQIKVNSIGFDKKHFLLTQTTEITLKVIFMTPLWLNKLAWI